MSEDRGVHTFMNVMPLTSPGILLVIPLSVDIVTRYIIPMSFIRILKVAGFPQVLFQISYSH